MTTPDPCTCSIIKTWAKAEHEHWHIDYCPLHASAGELRDALAPFAACIAEWDSYNDGSTPDDEFILVVWRDSKTRVTRGLTFGDLRRARAALAAVTPQENRP